MKNAVALHGRRMASFALVGVVNTMVDLAVFVVAFYAVAAPLLLAHIAGFLVGSINSYLLNHKFTFAGSGAPRSLSGFLRFMIVTGLALGLSSVVILALDDLVHVLAAKAAAILCTMVVGYSGSSLWVFRKPDGERTTG